MTSNANTVIGNAPLRKVISPDAFRSVSTSYLSSCQMQKLVLKRGNKRRHSISFLVQVSVPALIEVLIDESGLYAVQSHIALHTTLSVLWPCSKKIKNVKFTKTTAFNQEKENQQGEKYHQSKSRYA